MGQCKIRICVLVPLIFGICSFAHSQSDFYAYHTKLVHTSTDYFGKYADLIVVLGEGRELQFTRRTQYLPLWVTPGGSYMVDDFYPERKADHQFFYNYVRLLEESPDKIVVHWRYIPDIESVDQANLELDPTFYGGFTAAVHEFFTIYPDGRVEREVRDARGSDYFSWNKPDYGDRQTLKLKDAGIEHSSVTWGDRAPQLPEFIRKNPVINQTGGPEPILRWTFDEGGGDFPGDALEMIEEILEEEPSEAVGITFESITEEVNEISGHGALYKKGVSGTALAFDGYYTGVSMSTYDDNPNATYYDEMIFPQIEEALSLEAWVALDVYPYNLAPIVHHSTGMGESGYYLGVDPYGHVVLKVNGKRLATAEPLELYRWTHVAAVVGGDNMAIYVDGKRIVSESFEGIIYRPKTDFMIGLNNERERCSDFVRSNMQNIPFIFGIQGLIDEVKVYDFVLSDKQIKKNYETFVPTDRTSPLEKAVLPGEVGQAAAFGAYYKNLEHHELWDRMWRLPQKTNIVVKFENNPASVVYWHGTNFAANWVTDNNRWMADQSSEIFTQYGCSEHMADKQTRHSYARIIENNEARVIVHWRYPCVDVGYVCTNKRNWTDEYHTIYPDGTAIRKVIFNNTKPPGFQDIQFFTNPGETALDVVDINAMTIANTKGETEDLVWEMPNLNPDIKLKDATIQLLNSKSQWKVFAIYPEAGLGTWGEFEQSKYTEDPFAGPWNHWPISLVPSDGRYAVAHDRVTHFALGAADSAPEWGSRVHYGFTNQDARSLADRAKFWQNPPQLVNVKGCNSLGFNKDEKAYLLDQIVRDPSLSIAASEDSPVVNPAFVFENSDLTNATVKVDGKKFTNFRVGKARNTQGQPRTIVWLELERSSPLTITFKQ